MSTTQHVRTTIWYQLNYNDRNNSDNALSDLLEAIMSDDGDLNVIETRQHIFDKVQTITTLVEQCTDKQIL